MTHSKTLYKKTLARYCLCFLVFYLAGCWLQEKPVNVSLKKRQPLKRDVLFRSIYDLKIAIDPSSIFGQDIGDYFDFADYLSRKLDLRVHVVFKKSPYAVSGLLKYGEADAAFIGAGTYSREKDDLKAEIVAAPEMFGKVGCFVYVLASKDSGIKKMDDLKGKIFAFTNAPSNTGKNAVVSLLLDMKEKPETFFKQYVYTYNHYSSIRAVAEKKVDAASVSSCAFELIKKIDPAVISGLNIIFKSRLYPTSPFVVRSDIEPELKNRLKEVLLNMHKDLEGRRILGRMSIDKFVALDEDSYADII